MSQLRKSASFRSRIPIRRSNIPNRRCRSPPASSHNKNDNGSNDNSGGGNVPHKRSRRSHKSRNFIRRYSSSSYSSSDESFISDQPIKKKINHFNPTPELFYTSNDALSLNALLDSVSSGGTFSSPPSPIHQIYENSRIHHSSDSYESLDRYDVALEKLRITDNLSNIGVKLPYPSHEETRRVHQKFITSNLKEKRDIQCQENKYGSDSNLKVKQLKDDWYNLRKRQNFNNGKHNNNHNNARIVKRIDDNATTSNINKNFSGSRHQGHRMKKILSRIPNSLLSSQDEISILPAELRDNQNTKCSNGRKQQLQNHHLYHEHRQYSEQEQQHHHMLNSSNSIVKKFNHKKKESFELQQNPITGSILTPSKIISTTTPIPLNIKESSTFLSRKAISRDHIVENNDNNICSGKMNCNLKEQNFDEKNSQQYYWNQDESQSFSNDDIKERDRNGNFKIQNKFNLPIPSAFDACYEVSQNLQHRLQKQQQHQILENDSYNRKRNGVFWFSSSHSNSPELICNDIDMNVDNKESIILRRHQRQNEEQTASPPSNYYNRTNLYENDGIEMETLKIRAFENDLNLMPIRRNVQKQKYKMDIKTIPTSENIIKISNNDPDTELYTTFNQENYKNMCRNMAENSFQKRNNRKNKFISGMKMITGQVQNFSSFKDTTIPSSRVAQLKNEIEEYQKNHQRNENNIPNFNRTITATTTSTEQRTINDIDNIADDDDIDVDDIDDNHIKWYKTSENFWQLKKSEYKEKQKMTEDIIENEKIKEDDGDDSNSKFNKTTKQKYSDNDRNEIEQDNINIDIDNRNDDSEMYYQNIDESYSIKQHQHHLNQHPNNNNVRNKASKYYLQTNNHQCLSQNFLRINSPAALTQISTSASENRNQISHLQNSTQQLTQIHDSNIHLNNNNNNNNNENGLFQQLNIIGIPTSNPYLNIYKNSNSSIISSNDNKNHFHNEQKNYNECSITTEISSDRIRTPTNCGTELARKYLEAKRRPLPKIPLQDEVSECFIMNFNYELFI